MDSSKVKLIRDYYNLVKEAQKELIKKELFKDLLNRLYDDPEILKIVDAMSAGSEKAIFNIPRKDKIHRGSADTLYSRIIIEFENDLSRTFEHAKEQLAGYMLGQFNSGEGYNFTLIASDCINWHVFTIDLDQIERLGNLTESEVELVEVPNTSFSLTEKNSEDFYYWIDRFLFKTEKQRATLERIKESFGFHSNVFVESLRLLTTHFQEAKKFGEVNVAYEQWEKFLSVAYGSFEGSEESFLVHTYLSVFSKLLAYSVLSNDEFINDEELLSIINGSIFNKFNIQNFVDNDFYHWVGSERSFKALKEVFHLIAQEISNFDFNTIDEDVLKGVYQELIDLDTRRELGEYYTPDWLCEKVLERYELKEGDKILDPSCGSGSFLRAVYHRMKQLNPDISIESINDSIYGIDIHPLSVQIAKTTLLLTLGKGVIKSKKPIRINVILANTLHSPKGVASVFGDEFKMDIDRDTLHLKTVILENSTYFDTSLEVCEELANQTLLDPDIDIKVFTKILKSKLKQEELNSDFYKSFHDIYLSLKKAKKQGRDSIWKFIISNLYKPYFLKGRFDYIVGNPPWFTFSAIKNESYQNLLNDLALEYNIKPKKVADFPHLEIAAIFMAYCSNYFLKTNGELGFVVPRSFFSASQHDKTRHGNAEGFILTELWDLDGVHPLFNVPSAVLFTERTDKNTKYENGLKGLLFQGKVPDHNCNLKVAENHLEVEETMFFLGFLGNNSAFATQKINPQKLLNPYKKKFRQGATITPRSFYFVDLDQEEPPDYEDRVINVKTTEDIPFKPPWNHSLKGQIESRFLFSTALANNILPFALYKPCRVVLPITIEENQGRKEIKTHTSRDLISMGYLKASKWFRDAENLWDVLRTEKNKKYGLEEYLDWQYKLTSQDVLSPYIVLYTASSKDANATVIERKKLDHHFIVECVSYAFYCIDVKEANFLAAYLNSSKPNETIKAFQAKGLFGARHVHKKILDVYFPEFDKSNPRHLELAELGKMVHEKAKVFVTGQSLPENLSPRALGSLRTDIKKHLEEEMTAIDRIVEELMRG